MRVALILPVFLIGLSRDGDHNKIFVGWRESFCVPVCPHVLRFVCVCVECADKNL